MRDGIVSWGTYSSRWYYIGDHFHSTLLDAALGGFQLLPSAFATKFLNGNIANTVVLTFLMDGEMREWIREWKRGRETFLSIVVQGEFSWGGNDFKRSFIRSETQHTAPFSLLSLFCFSREIFANYFHLFNVNQCHEKTALICVLLVVWSISSKLAVLQWSRFRLHQVMSYVIGK